MSIINKFNKRITMIVDKNTHFAANWVNLLLKRLDLCDWRYPKIIITNKNRKFLSKLLTKTLHKFGNKLFYSTAYHPQIDGNNEKKNQILKTTFKHYIHIMKFFEKWARRLSNIQIVQSNVFLLQSRKFLTKFSTVLPRINYSTLLTFLLIRKISILLHTKKHEIF